MPCLKPSKMIWGAMHRASRRTIDRTVGIRGLAAIQNRPVRHYGTGKYIKNEPDTQVSENFPPSMEIRSREDAIKKVENKQTAAQQNTSEQDKREELEERAYQAEVERHNKEFAQGFDRAPEAPSEMKVDERYWKGKQFPTVFYLSLENCSPDN